MIEQKQKTMRTFIYKNTKTLETKPAIKTLSFELADEFFGITYWYTNADWETIEL